MRQIIDYTIVLFFAHQFSLFQTVFSKINQDTLRETIKAMKSEKKARKFVESVELQIGLRNYDIDRDKRFAGSITLPFCPHPRLRMGVIGTVTHCDQAKLLNIESIDQEGLKKFNKDLKLIKKWAKKYDVLLASESLQRLIPRLLGNALVKIRKFPYIIGENEKLADKVEEMKNTVRFQLKKVLCLGTAIGTVDLSDEQIRQNLVKSINFLVSLLKKGWQNINTLHIKTSMGKAYRIYGQ